MPQELYRIDHDKFRACVDKWDLPSRVADMCKINKQTMYLVYNKKQLSVSKEFMDKWEIHSPFSISQILASPEKKQVYLPERKGKAKENKKPISEYQQRTIEKRMMNFEKEQELFITEHTDVIAGIRRNITKRLESSSMELQHDISQLVLTIAYQSMAFGMDAVKKGYEKPLEQQLAKFYSVRSFHGKRY